MAMNVDLGASVGSLNAVVQFEGLLTKAFMGTRNRALFCVLLMFEIKSLLR